MSSARVGEWTADTFHDAATRWVSEACAAVGIGLTGESEQPHVRPWSSAIRYRTDHGPVWFKVNGPGTASEPALLDALSRLTPDLVPEIIAVDAGRGWSLARDAGPVMRSTAPPGELWAAWEQILRRYAEAQIRLADHTQALLGAGVEDLSVTRLPATARRMLIDLESRSPEEGGLTPAEADTVRGRLRVYDAWCAELAGSGIPSSIQHDDLHSANVCWRGSVEQARIIDWGDASVAHPLATMLCTLNSIAFHAECEVDDPRVRRVRDAYLEPFTRYADRAALVRYVHLARRTGCVSRARSWASALQGEPPATHAEWDFPARAWLLEMLEEQGAP